MKLKQNSKIKRDKKILKERKFKNDIIFAEKYTSNYYSTPEGWVRVTWKDAQDKVWRDNIPEATLEQFKWNVLNHGGIIIKIHR
jgi:hypothetical protein